MGKDKEMVTIEGLGEVEVLKHSSFDKNDNVVAGVLTMSQKNLDKFYEENGIPDAKKVFSTIEDARAKLVETAVTALKPRVLEEKNDWELRAGTGNQRIVVGIDATKNIRNVQTGETSTKYGSVYVRMSAKAPVSEVIQGISADIEAELKSVLGK